MAEKHKPKIYYIGNAEPVARAREYLSTLLEEDTTKLQFLIIVQMKDGTIEVYDNCGDHSLGFINAAIADLTNRMIGGQVGND